MSANPNRAAARAVALEARARLCERFPSAFRGEGAAKLPLAVGIYGEIRKRRPEASARRPAEGAPHAAAGTAS